MHIIEANYQKTKILLENSNNQLQTNTFTSTPLHSHLYCEIQIVTEGTAFFTIDGKGYTLSENEAILIPPHRYHTVEAKAAPLSRISFYAECEENEITHTSVPQGLITEIQEKSNSASDISAIYNHLFFILNALSAKKHFKLSPFHDYHLKIREFLSLNYNKKITLSDLANELHLSPMQTQRVIKKHTNKTFGENLLIQRMRVAENLMKTTTMTLTEIAEYVGYNSYCGFWKAYKKHKSSESEESAIAQK